jgi:HSP20 family protein
MPDRAFVANFERMRREMDELLGGLFERTTIAGRREGFSPRVDVAYTSDPPRAIVTAELAGVDADEIDLEIQGRELILAGFRRLAKVEGDVYQQVEIERGRFRRVIELGADVRPAEAKASYDDGILRIELPLAHSESRMRAVPIESDE